MDFNPNNGSDIQTLSQSVGYSRKSLGVFRENRLALIRQYVGRHYSNNGAEDKVPINLLELSMNIYLQRLVGNAPSVNITTLHRKLRELCVRLEIAGSKLIKDIKLGNTLEMAVTGALFSIGIIKVGLNRTQVELGGVLHDSGQAFAESVSLDDWVHDMTVDNFENGQYEGNYYYPTLDEAYQVFPKKVHDKLVSRDEQQPESDRDHNVSEGESTRREEFRETIKCLDLWLPKQGLILQCQCSDDDTDPIAAVLNVIEWTGRELGPYHKLAFSRIENNTMPLAPAMHLLDLHELANALFRRLGRQADREKKFVGVQRGGDQDAAKIRDVNDGEAIALDNPKNTQEYKLGGISPESLGFLLQVKELFSYCAGNLDSLGGLGPQSETLGQDTLLSASASMRIQKMQKSVYEFTQGVVEDLISYQYSDPTEVIKVTKKIKGFDDISVETPIYPYERIHDFQDFNIKIEPYSMQHKTPEAKLQSLRTVFMEMIMPLLPMMQAQGITLDIEALMKKISELGNLPELQEILIYSNPNHEQEPVGELPAKPATTTRRYERVNRPGATNQGKSQIMQQALFGGNPQKSEKAAVFRQTG